MNSKEVKHLILTNYYSILQIKQTYIEKINILLYQILAFNYTWENIEKPYKNNKFKISAPIWNEELDLYLMDSIRYQIFKIILNIY